MASAPRVVWMPGRLRTEIHLTAEDTAGAFCMLVDHPLVGWSLPAHLHRGVTETIHILSGEFEMTIDGRRSRLLEGQTAHIPPDVIHAGGNVGPLPGRRLVIFAPAGMERFFLEVGGASEHAEIEPAAVLDSAIRHGWEFAAQPPQAQRRL
jgi:quercetin dioxygenase-like cupin family protein